MKIYSQISQVGITEEHFQFDPSFGPYIKCLQQKMEESTDIIGKFYRYLIKKFQQHPHLLKPFKNVEILEQHDDLIQLLKMSLLPLSDNSEVVPMALAFMQPSCIFYYTPSFKKNFIEEHIEFDTKEDEILNLRYFIKLVLKRCYNIDTDDNSKNIKQVKNRETGVISHHLLNIESRFIQVHCKGKLPPFQDQWRKIISADDEDFFEFFNRFPSHLFRLEGFCMFSTVDVSKDVALNELKNAILNMHTTELAETLEQVEQAIGELLNDPKIRIAVTPFFKINGRVVYNSYFIPKGLKISSIEKRVKTGETIEEIYRSLSLAPEPYIVSNFDKEFVISRATLSDLVQHDIKNLMVYPITTMRDGLMGVFELEKGNITPATIEFLQPAFALIADLIYYMIEMFDNKINKLVKEKFTPLLQSVEWKFNEVAWEYLKQHDGRKLDEAIGDVGFKQVHPLYGAVDIKDSSTERNNALKDDCLTQLTATLELLQKISFPISLPLLDSIKFKCDKFIHAIAEGLSSENELKISKFFSNEVKVFFNYLAARHPEYTSDVNDYLRKTDREKGAFHQHLRAYESTVHKINKNLLTYFEEEVEKLQVIYPFYYEKYRTDGVEYNIYIGQSIAPGKPFDTIYLKNLRLWQVTSMAQIALSNHKMLSTLPIPLQTTQLILVHSLAIDISFRKDERRFDVEGSYNIRYEILKKRIDKVRVKNTLERLTQPDKIAIVYSTSSEVEEYLQHISFLQSKGILTDNIETLELESLQGVSGLKALRIGVHYEIDTLGDFKI